MTHTPDSIAEEDFVFSNERVAYCNDCSLAILFGGNMTGLNTAIEEKTGIDSQGNTWDYIPVSQSDRLPHGLKCSGCNVRLTWEELPEPLPEPELPQSDILAWEIWNEYSGLRDAYLCDRHAFWDLLGGDLDWFTRIATGKNTSFIDIHGDSFGIIHEGSIQYEQFPEEWFPEGCYCHRCGTQLIEPQEESEDEE